MDPDLVLRAQLLALLRGGNAHLTYDEAVAEFPPGAMNQRPPNVPYTPWHLLEHLRIAQWDIIEFVLNPKHISPAWPEGYWPAQEEKADEAAWLDTIRRFRKDYSRLEDLVNDSSLQLESPIVHAPGYTILGEILLASDHNAYHIGEFAVLRQIMGTWPTRRRPG